MSFTVYAMKQKFLTARKLIETAQNILLLTHRDPDIDGIGSMLALMMTLEKIGKNVTAFSPSPLPLSFKFLPRAEKIKYSLNGFNFDLFIGLDYGSFERLELNQNILPERFLTFDHHLAGRHWGLQIVDNRFSSTAEIIYCFLNFLSVPLERETATCLLAGIFDDTGGFHHANTTAQTLKIAGELMLKGATLSRITKITTQPEPQKKIKTWAKILEKVEVYPETGLVLALIDYHSFARLPDHFAVSSLVNFLSAVPEAKVALLLVEKSPGYFEGSLRAQKDREIDVTKIARVFGGGGHKLAAGFQTTAKPAEITSKIRDLLSTDHLKP